jgi:Rho-type GTPase-activating protein 1/2
MERQVNEKRSTMVVLDAQKELVVRELEVMVDHLRKVKDASNPLDMATLKSEVLRDFMASVNELKQSVTSEIESLVHKRNDLGIEITQLIQVKDKGLQEYESLSNRNAQLVQHNNELIQNLQMMGGKPTNGLGLYLPGKDKTESPPNELGNLHDSSTTLATFADSEHAVIQTPHLIKMKQQKPTLRKGGLGNALRGLKGAFGDRGERTTESISMPYSQMETSGGAIRTIDLRQDREPKHKFGGFFSSDKAPPRNGRPPMRYDQKPMTPVPGRKFTVIVTKLT